MIEDWYYSYTNGWENHNCELPLPFVCEVVAGIEPPTTAPVPTLPPSLPCQEGADDGWIKMADDNEFCYKFVAAGSEDDTFMNSEYNCQMEVRIIIILECFNLLSFTFFLVFRVVI